MTCGTDILVPTSSTDLLGARSILPASIAAFGAAGGFCWDEFFSASIRNKHTRAAYMHAVKSFLAWAESLAIQLPQIQPGHVGLYFEELRLSIPSKKLHLAALRSFFDLLVTRHLLILNPAATVRGERYSADEGRTPEISKAQIHSLIGSINISRPPGLRDRAILATMIYTAARVGAVADLRIGDFTSDESQYLLRFREKNGKLRTIPVRHDLQLILLGYLECFDWHNEAKDSPFFRSVLGRTKRLSGSSVRNTDIARMLKRRLSDAKLPGHLSCHSFRVATVTDLLTQGVSLEDVAHLAGHSDPRTTRLYDRRPRQITRNTVERISL